MFVGYLYETLLTVLVVLNGKIRYGSAKPSSFNKATDYAPDLPQDLSLNPTFDSAKDTTLDSVPDQPLKSAVDQTLDTAPNPEFDLELDPTLNIVPEKTLKFEQNSTLDSSSGTIFDSVPHTQDLASNLLLDSETDLKPDLQTGLKPVSYSASPIENLQDSDQEPAINLKLRSAQGQVQPIGTGPVQPIGTGPVQPIGTGPVQPIGTGPVRPIGTGPVQPIGTDPVQPIGTGPVQPIGTGPVQPIGTGPVQPIGTGPALRPGTRPVQPIGPDTEQKINETIRNVLELSNGMSHFKDTCDPDLEQIINILIHLIKTTSPPSTEVEIVDALKLVNEKMEKLGPDTHICNRTRLMLCNPTAKDPKKYMCSCAEGTALRHTFKRPTIKSHFCYKTEGACDADVATVVPIFPGQEQDMYKHYGDPRDKPDQCLPNLCVARPEADVLCKGYSDEEDDKDESDEDYDKDESDEEKEGELRTLKVETTTPFVYPNNWYDGDNEP